VVNTNNIWQNRGESFHPNTKALNVDTLPPAIYRFAADPAGWWLEKVTDRYTFPYKIYGVNDAIIDRIKRAWCGLPASFGVLLNGLKGTGKTITAQQIVNWALDEGIMVLNVHNPVPLADIMAHVNQPMVILFDEFEKTHDADEQQKLLSALDGLSRNEFKRLFIFTTNKKEVNDNLIDRPSRIRYIWEFDRVGSDLIEMLVNDLLEPSLAHLKPEIISYLNTRNVLTIDAIKTTLTECNIFQESPEKFKTALNLSEKAPGAFKLELIDDLGNANELSNYFKLSESWALWLLSMMSATGRQQFIDNFCANKNIQTLYSSSGQAIEIVGPTDKNDEWICHIQVPLHKTWIDKKPKLIRTMSRDHLWLDEKPYDWRIPEWARKAETTQELSDFEETERDEWFEAESVYGTDTRKRVIVRFTLNNDAFAYDARAFMRSVRID
jgi:GTPase SAR1 family protein